MKKLVGALGLVGAMLCAHFAAAQTAPTVTERYEVVKGAQSISVLGPDMLGEQMSLTNGAMPFRALDIAYYTDRCSGWQGPTSP